MRTMSFLGLSASSFKDYSHILDDVEFDTRYDEDQDYYCRCLQFPRELFRLIRTTVQTCERIPEKTMTEYERDWLACARALVSDVEDPGREHRIACKAEMSRIVPLAKKLPELAFTEEVVADRIRVISAFLTTGEPASS
jgi:hypothetical protein